MSQQVSSSKYMPTNVVPQLENMEDIQMERLNWLWPGRIPLGKLTMLVGDPGLGKSFLSLYIAARVSNGGYWPDDKETPCVKGSVVIVTAEDDAADTIKPRLCAAGADMRKIKMLRGMTTTFQDGTNKNMFFDLKLGVVALERLKEQVPDLSLLIIDPITAYMGNIDSHANADVRSVLDRVAEWAAKHQVSILAISHLNKNTGVSIQYRTMGSMAFVAVSRMGWVIAKDKDDPERRKLLPGKNNMCQEQSGLAYRLKSVKIKHGDEELDSAVCEFEDGTLKETAEQELASIEDSLESTTKKAKEWIKDMLGSGPMMQDDLFGAGEAEKLTRNVLKRALKDLGCKREPKNGGFEWIL